MTWKIPLSVPLLGPEEMQAVQRVLASTWLTMGEETLAFEEEFAAFLGVKHALACSSGTAALHLAMLAVGIGAGSRVIQPAVNFVAAANMTMACGAEPLFTDILALDEPTLSPDGLKEWLEKDWLEVVDPVVPGSHAGLPAGTHVGTHAGSHAGTHAGLESAPGLEHLAEAGGATPLAVVVMHYGGFPCRMEEVLARCRERGIPVIEDACHSPGGRLRVVGAGGAVGQGIHAPPGHGPGFGAGLGLGLGLGLGPDAGPDARSPYLGTLGDVGCFSFFSNKNMATGEGGMVVTNRDDLAAVLRSLRSHGMTTLTWDRHHGHAATYDVTAHGFNYRIDELRSAIGREQLRKLTASNQRRRELTALYWEVLAPLEARGWLLPFKARFAGAGLADSACHLMTLVAPDREHRWRAAAALREAGIQTSLHYPFIPSFNAFGRHIPQGTLLAPITSPPISPSVCQDSSLSRPVGHSQEDLQPPPTSRYNSQHDWQVPLTLADAYCTRTITLPLYPAMIDEDIRSVATVLLSCT